MQLFRFILLLLIQALTAGTCWTFRKKLENCQWNMHAGCDNYYDFRVAGVMIASAI